MAKNEKTGKKAAGSALTQRPDRKTGGKGSKKK